MTTTVHSEQFVIGDLADNQIQPNAIDITLDRVWQFEPARNVSFVVRKDGETEQPNKVEMQPSSSGFYRFNRPNAYNFESDLRVELPEGVIGLVVPRSTLNRNGITIVSGLYDSGYRGTLGGTLYIIGHDAFIEKGARVAQFITFANCHTRYMYSGQWQDK